MAQETAGRVYAAAGRFREAAAQRRRSPGQAAQVGATALVWPLRAALGDCLTAAGQTEAARAEYRQAAAVVRELAGTLPRAADRTTYLRSGPVAGVLELAKG